MLLAYCSPRVCVKCAPSGVYLPGGWGSIGFKKQVPVASVSPVSLATFHRVACPVCRVSITICGCIMQV